MHAFQKEACMVILEIDFVLWKTFVFCFDTILFVTLLKNHNNYRDTEVLVGSLASLLW